jgi:hypothetical protein
MSCLGITGAMGTAPTAAMEVLRGFPTLYLQMEAVVKIGKYRLRYSDQWKHKSEVFISHKFTD